MGVTKKPAVIAKTAPKKRGRPVGSKNKSKTEVTVNSVSSTGWVPPQPVDWERLAKRLQEALAIEMKTVEGMEKLFEEFRTVSTKVSALTLWQRIKLVVTGKY